MGALDSNHKNCSYHILGYFETACIGATMTNKLILVRIYIFYSKLGYQQYKIDYTWPRPDHSYNVVCRN